jgi:hypothetical protein
MAMFDDIFSGKNGVAYQLLKTMGITSTYIKAGEKVFDPRTDTYLNNKDIETKVITSPPLKYNVYEKANSDIAITDRKLIVYADDFIDINDTVDKVVVQGITYVIRSHEGTSTGNKDAIITLHLRRV